jgi:hypothetical protein
VLRQRNLQNVIIMPNPGLNARNWIASVVAISTVLSANIALAPPAPSEPSPILKDAVMQARAGSSCGPLRYNPIAEQVADISNQSQTKYIDHTARDKPIADPRPGLQDLGYHGSKGVLLLGAAKNMNDSVRAALLQGFIPLPDCSYTDFGVSMLYNETKSYYLTSIVLAGP